MVRRFDRFGSGVRGVNMATGPVQTLLQNLGHITHPQRPLVLTLAADGASLTGTLSNLATGQSMPIELTRP